MSTNNSPRHTRKSQHMARLVGRALAHLQHVQRRARHMAFPAALEFIVLLQQCWHDNRSCCSSGNITATTVLRCRSHTSAARGNCTMLTRTARRLSAHTLKHGAMPFLCFFDPFYGPEARNSHKYIQFSGHRRLWWLLMGGTAGPKY